MQSKVKNNSNNLTLLLVILPLILSLLFIIYSYFWIDHGLVTFLSDNRPEIGFFFKLIQFTSDHKILMAQLFLLQVIILFGVQLLFLLPKIYLSIPLKPLMISLGIITLIYSLSYPFLSKDIFYYYISAKMAYFYHLSPFTTTPIELAGKDFFVMISHNIRSPYLYGPFFLAYSILPMVIVSAQKVILYFVLLKLLNGLLFFIGGLLLYKITRDKRIFSIWFLNPFLLIEWLANSHNDVVMITFLIISVYFATQRKIFKSMIFAAASLLTKIVSILAIPIIFLKGDLKNYYLKIMGLSIPYIIYFAGRTIEPWYSSWSFMFLPLANLKTHTWIIFYLVGFISLANYYRFLESSGWGAGYIIPYPHILTNLILILAFTCEYWQKVKDLSVKILRPYKK